MKLNWNLQGDGEVGSDKKKPPWKGYGYFLEQHILKTR